NRRRTGSPLDHFMPHPDEHVVDPPRHPYTIEFYADPETGREHVREWIKQDLTPFQRRSIGIAMSEILEVNGINVCTPNTARTSVRASSSSACGTGRTTSSQCSPR